VCLTIEQAQMSQDGAGATCATQGQEEGAVAGAAASMSASSASLTRDYQDASCVDAYARGEQTSSDACLDAVDEDDMPCQYCTRDTINHLCLTASQGDLLSTMGFWCDKKKKAVPRSSASSSKSVEDHQEDEFNKEEELAVPDDFFQCLQSYEPDDCQAGGCTWCDSQVGIGFCTSDAVADSMKACTFFDCQYKNENNNNANANAAAQSNTDTDKTNVGVEVESFDSSCMNAGFANPQHGEEACRGTSGQSGQGRRRRAVLLPRPGRQGELAIGVRRTFRARWQYCRGCGRIGRGASLV
jgi:hypothetical protein